VEGNRHLGFAGGIGGGFADASAAAWTQASFRGKPGDGLDEPGPTATTGADQSCEPHSGAVEPCYSRRDDSEYLALFLGFLVAYSERWCASGHDYSRGFNQRSDVLSGLATDYGPLPLWRGF
jgi:hypothetical protein